MTSRIDRIGSVLAGIVMRKRKGKRGLKELGNVDMVEDMTPTRGAAPSTPSCKTSIMPPSTSAIRGIWALSSGLLLNGSAFSTIVCHLLQTYWNSFPFFSNLTSVKAAASLAMLTGSLLTSLLSNKVFA